MTENLKNTQYKSKNVSLQLNKIVRSERWIFWGQQKVETGKDENK